MYKNLELSEKIFIAGATGMVGASIKRALKMVGFKEGLNGNLLTPKRSEVDLTDYQQLDNWFKINLPTIIIIAAAKVGGIYANNNQPFDFLHENLKIEINLIELSYKYRVKTLLFLGSSCIYPKFAPQPIKEEYLLSDSLEKTNEYYALAKITGIKLCQALNIQHGFNSICLMPTNLYGPGDNYHSMNSHVIPGLIRKFYEGKKNNSESVICWGSGKPLREFLYVDDLAQACLHILSLWNTSSEKVPLDKNGNPIFWLNVGSHFEISIKNLALEISKAIDFKGKILWDQDMPDGTPRKKLDTSKINNLGWEASTNIHDGINLTLKYFKDELEKDYLRQ